MSVLRAESRSLLFDKTDGEAGHSGYRCFGHSLLLAILVFFIHFQDRQ